LALADGGLAGVAPYRAVPGEAQAVGLTRPVAVAEDLRRAGRLVDDRLARGAGRVDDPRIGEADRAVVQRDVAAAGDPAGVGAAAAAREVVDQAEIAHAGGRDVEAIATGRGRGEADVVLRAVADVLGAQRPRVGVDVPGVAAGEGGAVARRTERDEPPTAAVGHAPT